MTNPDMPWRNTAAAQQAQQSTVSSLLVIAAGRITVLPPEVSQLPPAPRPTNA